MSSDRFARVKELLLEILDLSPEERQTYLDRTCQSDPDLRKEVEAILAHDDEHVRMLATGGAAPDVSRELPERIAGYRILSCLGEGGMGEVYLAEQTEPVRRRVALKVIKAGMDTKQVVARFEAERQALAMMDHPHIAKVFDAGATEDGRPFFVMEHVPGETITAYCDRRRFSTRERLDLFIQVCEAVQHAHQRGIIHRDLKPMNMLVEEVDGRAIPKVIDFGIAKATAQPLTERTLFTERGQLIGTPEYMSPEQAESGALDIDTRTDIYSLGVVLYELLVGSLPFDSRTLREAGYAGIQRILREKEPPRPSTRLETPGPDTEAVARSRNADRSTLLGQLRGDLDWIVMKALEKDRDRRYASSSEFAADVGRYLASEPILARPPSITYLLGKLVARHRVPFAFATAILLLVTASAVTMAFLYQGQRAARNEAEQVTTTLEEMLASVDPTKSGRDVTVREMLDETAKTLGEKLKDVPLVEARLRRTVGVTYDRLGVSDVAEKHLETALAIQRERLGEGNPETLETMDDLVRAVSQLGHYEDAESLAVEACEISSRVLGKEAPATLKAMRRLGQVYFSQGRYGEAVALLEEIVEKQQRMLGPEDRETLTTKNNLAVLYSRQGRNNQAEALQREMLEINRRVLGEKDPVTQNNMGMLAATYYSQGKYDESAALGDELLEIELRVLGEEHPLTLRTMTNLAWAYTEQGRDNEAEALMRRAVEISRRAPGDEHPGTWWTMFGLAKWYERQGRYKESGALLKDAVDLGSRAVGEENRLVLDFRRHLVRSLSMQGRFDEAETAGRETLEAMRRVFGEEDGETNGVRYNLASNEALRGRRDEALSFLKEALDHGYRDPLRDISIADDPKLVSLHGDPEFEAIVQEVKRRNEASATVERATETE